jgi:outer membrane protein OmpA-like peptidoglycan-associated protein
LDRTPLKYLTIILVFLAANATAQNLLPNAGFEDVNTCAEYKMPCGPKGWFGVPVGTPYYDKSAAYEGRSGLKFTVFDFTGQNKRSFVQTEILVPLRKDSQYKIELFVFGDCIDPGKLSFYLPSEDFLYEKDHWRAFTPAAGYTASYQLVKTSKKYWNKLTLGFKATGKERYFVIGNFSNADFDPVCEISENQLYYTIDNISLTPVNFKETIGPSALNRQAALFARTERHELLKDIVMAYHHKPVQHKNLRIDTLVIPDVLFAVNDDRVQGKTKTLIDNFLKGINLGKLDSIVVEGHADITGTSQRNEALSRGRAATVRTYILSKVPALVIDRGWGSMKPVADNSTEKGRQKNRRVVIYLYMKS